MIRVLLLVIGYCLGMIQTGYLYGRMKGIDIRKAGSGNSGATNSLRVLGKKAGLIVFVVDLCKCFIPCLIVKAWAVSSGQQHMEDIYMLYLAFGVILGHNYPCYLNFKGGKGISSTSGFILAFDLRIDAVCLAAFSVIVGTTRYVSLGSLTVVSICFVMGVIFGVNGMLSVEPANMAEFIILLALITIQAYIRHRANIKRLLNGTENKIGAKK